jgi:hypothetical protein
MGKWEIYTKIILENRKERDRWVRYTLEQMGGKQSTKMQAVIDKWGVWGLDLVGSGYGRMAALCEHGDGHEVTICGEDCVHPCICSQDLVPELPNEFRWKSVGLLEVHTKSYQVNIGQI